MAYNYGYAQPSSAAEIATALGFLTADELSAVLSSRHIEHLVQPTQNATLIVSTVAAQLAYAASITEALRELSLRELTVLRVLWRSGLSVSTRSIAPAFANILDKATIDQAVKRLQNMALVLPLMRDRSAVFVPSSVRAVLLGRNGPPRPAAEVFASLNGDTIKAIFTTMGLTSERNRQADRMQAIVDEIAKPAAVQRRVAALTPLAKRIFDDTVAHGGTAEPWSLVQRFPEARRPTHNAYAYSGYGNFFLTGREPATDDKDALLELQRQGLLVRHPPDWSSVFVIADEVITALLPALKVEPSDLVEPGFAAPSPEARPAGTHTAPVLDLVECLQFITDEKPSLTQKGLFPKPLSKRLARSLSVQDTVYADLLMALALSGDLTKRDGSAISVRPKKASVWLSAPDSEQRAALYDGWLGLLTWLDDRDEPYPRTSDARGSVASVRAIAAQILADLPEAGATIASIAGRLRYRMPGWFAADKAGLPVDGTTRTDPAAFIRGMLRDLGWLGYAEPLQLTTRPGAPANTVALRLTPLGRAVLRGEEPPAETTVPRTDRLIVQPTLDVLAPPNFDPAAYQVLRRFADPAGASGMRTATLSPTSLRRALDAGMKPQAVRKFLEEHAGSALPPTVERLFSDVDDKYGRIHVGMAGFYLTVDDAHLLAELQADKRLQGLWMRPISSTVAVVHGDGLPQILDRLRGAGHMPIADGTVAKAQSAPAPVPLATSARGRRPNEFLDDDVAMQLLDDPAFALAALGLDLNGKPLTGIPTLRLVPSGAEPPRPLDEIPGAAVRVTDKPTIAELIGAAMSEAALIEMEYVARVKGNDQRRQLIVEPFEVIGDTVWATDQSTQTDKSYKLHRIAWARVVDE